jgi:hypothetical protein
MLLMLDSKDSSDKAFEMLSIDLNIEKNKIVCHHNLISHTVVSLQPQGLKLPPGTPGATTTTMKPSRGMTVASSGAVAHHTTMMVAADAIWCSC